MVIFFVIFLSTVIFTNLQPVYYVANATIKIDTYVLSDVLNERPYYDQSNLISDYQNWATSLPVVQRALKESGLLPKDASERDLDNYVSNVAGGLSAEQVKDTNMISLSLWEKDPKIAALLLNKIAQALKEENIIKKNQQIRNMREFIEKQLNRVAFQLKQSEDRLNYLTSKGVGGLATALAVKISDLESKRADLLTKFTELHPDVMKINEQIAALKLELKNLPKEEFDFSNLKRDVGINERLYSSLREKLQEAQIKESEKIDNIYLINPAIPPSSPSSPNKRRNYFVGIVLGLVFGIFVGLVSEHLDTSIGRIEDLEEITKISVVGIIPYYFRKIKEAKKATLRERFKGINFNFFKQKEVKKEEKTERMRSLLVPMYKESSVFLEAFRILGANVQVLFGNNERIKQKSIIITSANPEEGKSIIASNLSIVLAQMGYKVVLIDTDVRRSSLHNIFGLKKEKGLTDILTGEVCIDKAIRTIVDLLLGDLNHESILKNPWLDNFHLITAGTVFPNAPYLLNTENMNSLIKTLKEKYDVIIMDSSPVLAVSDTSIIVPKVDGALLVYRSGVTSRISLRRAKMQIESATKEKGFLKGIILNNVAPEASADAYYYYYRHKYYNEEKNQPIC